MTPTCPICDAALSAVQGPPGRNRPKSWSPWVCAPCARGWWDAELTAESRAAFRPQTRDFDTPDGTAPDLSLVLDLISEV